MIRKALIDRLDQNKDFSVLIIGAGINGAGLYRELCLQGISTLLIDKADFSSGASAASSRMIHGGLRYLENNEVKLVRESLTERNRLLQNAPHYVQPLPTTIPIFHWFSGLLQAIPRFLGMPAKSSTRGALLVKLGLSMYDWFTRGQRMVPAHYFSSRKKSLASRPLLNREIVCTATYHDAWISHPERLGLELIKDSEAVHKQALALNYASIISATADEVLILDEISQRTFSINPQIVVNASGAWIDFTNRAFGEKTTFIGGTKGSHLVIENEALMEATRGEMLYYENADGRICILFPFQGKVLLGSTDIKIDDPEQAVCDEQEVAYMLEAVRQIFPTIQVDRSQVIFRFCGVRPLPSSDTSVTAQISRDHSLKIIPPSRNNRFPIYNLIGGKWTTFRSFAEHVTDRILTELGSPRRSGTQELAIGGGKNFPKNEDLKQKWITDLHLQTQLPKQRIGLLLDRYGTKAEAVAKYLAAGPDQCLQFHAGYSKREIEYLIENEYVVHVDDLVLRRTTLAIKGELTNELLQELVTIQAQCLGWLPGEKIAEMERVLNILSQKHHLQLNQ